MLSYAVLNMLLDAFMRRVLQCPFCHAVVSRRTVVCRGCLADVEFGSLEWVGVSLYLTSAIAGLAVGVLTACWLGLAAAALGFAGGMLVSRIWNRDRVVFRR